MPSEMKKEMKKEGASPWRNYHNIVGNYRDAFEVVNCAGDDKYKKMIVGVHNEVINQH